MGIYGYLSTHAAEGIQVFPDGLLKIMIPMKQLTLYILVLLFVACKKEGGTPAVSGIKPAVLYSSTTELVLKSTDRKAVALQLVWDEAILASDEPMAQSALKNKIEIAADPSFSAVTKSIEQVASSLSYTHEQLNNLVTGMGFLPDEKNVFYVRIASRLGTNTDWLYSNVIALNVTAYQPVEDAAYLYLSNKEFTQFPWKLCSRKEDGFYDGFVRLDQWYNFYLTNAESASAPIIYGSYPLDGSQYILYSGADRWNCWTSKGGYLYLTADVNKLAWKETSVESLTVTGDFNGWSATATPMVYDQTTKVWKATITTTAAEQWGIKVLINGSWTWFFGAAEGDGNCALYTADGTGFAYNKIGTHTLILDLSDPKEFKYHVE